MNLGHIRTFFISLIDLCIVGGIIHIDRHTLDFDIKLSNWTISYFHDQTGNSVSTTIFETYVTFTKMLIYINIRVAEDQNDKEYRRELTRTVIDLGKFMKNTQSNPILKAFINGLRKNIQFKIGYPMTQVSLHQVLR